MGWQTVTGLAHEHDVALDVGGEFFSTLRITNHLGHRTAIHSDGFTVVPSAAGPWLAGLQAPRHASGLVWALEWSALLPSSPAPHDFRVAVGTGHLQPIPHQRNGAEGAVVSFFGISKCSV